MRGKSSPLKKVLAGGSALVALSAASLMSAVPASAATFYGPSLPPNCAQAGNSWAFSKQLKIPVTEASVQTYDWWGNKQPLQYVRTAYMTMNVQWCSSKSRTPVITYARTVTNNADVTSAGVASNLQRKSYQKDGRPAAAVGGAYTLVTSASWGRAIEGTATIGVASVKIAPADFTSTMTVKVYPGLSGKVECTGSAKGHPEPCSLNY